MQRFPYRPVLHLFVTGCLLLTLAGARAQEQKILVLGDSISAAYGMSLEQGWVALLGQRLQSEGRGFTIVNASISGETSAGGLRRLPPLLESHRPAAVIVELGANDGLRGFPLGRLRDNLKAIALAAQRAGARVILVPMEIPPNYGQRYTSGFRETFRAVAEETDSTLAPFIMREFATDPAFMQPDGIHPTAAAQPMMLELVYPTLLSTLEES